MVSYPSPRSGVRGFRGLALLGAGRQRWPKEGGRRPSLAGQRGRADGGECEEQRSQPPHRGEAVGNEYEDLSPSQLATRRTRTVPATLMMNADDTGYTGTADDTADTHTSITQVPV